MQYKGASISGINKLKMNSVHFEAKVNNKRNLIEAMSKRVYDYISQTVPLFSEKVIVVNNYKINEYYNLTAPILGVVDVYPINFSKNINDYLFNLNSHIPEATIFVGCFKVADSVKNTDSGILNRLSIKDKNESKSIYKAEALGRLVYAGFSIIEFIEIEGLLYVMSMKVNEAPKLKEGCSKSFVFPMERIGKDGRLLKIFKFRTMHPYSKYIQDYVVRLNGYNSVGKPSKDFRLTSWGRLFRKYWLDELPQIINVLRGEMTLVGVRPLSKTRFAELPDEVKDLRIKFKPGCIPPYVSLLMPDSKGNIEAERIYIKERMRNGFKTDIKYFFLAIKNILTGKITSA